ncbi:MAG: HTH domain-containing protein, partial [Clostridia bacterium]|nr:HTH domain-containing protein [Clostridia bacterium]
MKDKLCVSDRRRKMLDLLRVNRQLLKRDLADMFNVSVRTISRDILYLSSIAPITIK